jgi:hypothetical protein
MAWAIVCLVVLLPTLLWPVAAWTVRATSSPAYRAKPFATGVVAGAGTFLALSTAFLAFVFIGFPQLDAGSWLLSLVFIGSCALVTSVIVGWALASVLRE